MKKRICPACQKGEVKAVARPGLRRPFRTIPDLEVPAHVAIPTCSNPACAEQWIDEATTDLIEDALKNAYQFALSSKAEDAIAKLKPAIPQRDLERLLGLSGGYLSKLKSGKETTPHLVAALLLLAAAPRQRVDELKSLWAMQPAAASVTPTIHLGAATQVGSFSASALPTAHRPRTTLYIPKSSANDNFEQPDLDWAGVEAGVG